MAYIKKTDNPRMGRPTAAPRTALLQIRLSEEESAMIAQCAALTGKTKTELIIQGIKAIYAELTDNNTK